MKKFSLLLQNSSAQSFVFKTVSVVSGILVLAASSKLVIPFWPVPITGQTFAVLLIAMCLGPIRGALATVGYLGLGLTNVPVFAFAHGLFSPSFGYAAGFLPSAILMGWLFNKVAPCKTVKFFVISVVSLAPTFTLGLLWLGHFIGYSRLLLAVGLFPFVGGELLKIAILYAFSLWLGLNAVKKL